MNHDERLDTIRQIVQCDAGNRGWARDPATNLFVALPDDFVRACHSLAKSNGHVGIVTGFFIPTASPPSFETDGPPGAVVLASALRRVGINVSLFLDPSTEEALLAGLELCSPEDARGIDRYHIRSDGLTRAAKGALDGLEHLIFIECVGPAADGNCYSMRGNDVTGTPTPGRWLLQQLPTQNRPITIGVGDGGNEIGMGKIPPTIVIRNIPLGDRIHCRVVTDYLIVAGVSNWGAYALASGVAVLRGVTPPRHWFQPDEERRRIERMVAVGPLVDGVTGRPDPTVDGLPWEMYVQPLIKLGSLLES